jgi:cobalt-zinc-cadmium efflux system outer membrane protein
MSTIFVHPGAFAPGGRPHAVAHLTRQSLMLSVLLASAATLGHAAETPSYITMLEQSQAMAPRLLEQAANVQAATADARQSHVWLNPTLGATIENLGAPQSGGMSQRQDTLTVTQVFELGGKRAARIEAEQSKSTAVGARARQLRLAFAGELALAYATAEAMQQRYALAEADLARGKDDLHAAEALVKAGREAELRLAQARASIASAQAGVELARADADEALGRLSALAGVPEPFMQIDHPFLTALTDPKPKADWSLEEAPALASAAAERDAVAAQVKVEQKRALPDIGVTLGMRKFGWSDEKAATIGITATIPLFDRNQAGVDAAKARVAAAAMRLEGARLEVQAQHRAAASQVLASGRRLQAAEQGEAASTEAYRLGRLGYDAGKTALLELLAIRRALSEAKALTIEARLARVRALATLSLAEGRNLFGEAP